MIERVTFGDHLFAVIIRRDYREPGVHFATPGEFSQQLAYISHPAGHAIPAHFHRPVKRDVLHTLEVLVIRKGRLRVDFYSEAREPVGSCQLAAGDAILLVHGGHGFEVLEDCEMFEVKQGPYLGDDDKLLFLPAAPREAGQP